MQTRIAVEDEIRDATGENGWTLAFQKVTYIYPPGKPSEKGFRFIWYRENNTLQAARGQARIPGLAVAKALIDRAIAAGWED